MLRDQVPAEVFTTAYWNPVADSPRAARNNLLQAMAPMNEAGSWVRNMQLIDPAGEPFEIEFLIANRGFEPCALLYKAALGRLGMGVKVRLLIRLLNAVADSAPSIPQLRAPAAVVRAR
jgi:microcin C transport system substrate-binding protein